MGKPPAFQLYAADFYMDTVSWDVDLVGFYFRLLMYEWVNGSIPNDIEQIARITGGSVNRKWRSNVSRMFAECSHKFATLPGTNNLINERLENTRKEQEKYTKGQSESGHKGVEVKKLKGIYPFNKSSDPSSDPSSEQQALLLLSSLKKKEDIYIVEIVAYLNQTSGKNFKVNSKNTNGHIHSRLKEGFTVDQCKQVIDIKVGQWKNDPNFAKYIRLETLFGSKFESYLNEKPTTPKEGGFGKALF